MTSLMDTAVTLGHIAGGLMIAIFAMATVVGFIAGMFFERATGRHTRNGGK